MQTLTLYLLRHAKTENAGLTMEDKARALTPQGIAQAEALGDLFKHKHIVPDAVLCSTAVRTRETLQHVQRAFSSPFKAEFIDKLYHASANSMLSIIQHAHNSAKHLMVVGHNPGIHQLCSQLCAEGESRLLDEASIHYPPCTLAIVQFEAPSWSEISFQSGTLKQFITPEAVFNTYAA